MYMLLPKFYENHPPTKVFIWEFFQKPQILSLDFGFLIKTLHSVPEAGMLKQGQTLTRAENVQGKFVFTVQTYHSSSFLAVGDSRTARTAWCRRDLTVPKGSPSRSAISDWLRSSTNFSSSISRWSSIKLARTEAISS